MEDITLRIEDTFSESEADRDRDINILLDFEKKLQYFIIDESN